MLRAALANCALSMRTDMDSEVTISRAQPADLSQVLALLTSVDLPHEGVSDHLHNFFVAKNQTGHLLGCAGLERHGRLGLLRSVAVSPEEQHTGLGSKITAALLDYAVVNGIAQVVLLTTTARDFFASKFGFRETCREDFNEQLAESPEWKLPRCASAVCMSCDV